MDLLVKGIKHMNYDYEQKRSREESRIEQLGQAYFGASPPCPKDLTILNCASDKNCSLGLIRSFLSVGEVATVSELVSSSIGDLKEMTAGDDASALRIEKCIRLWRPELYKRLVKTAHAVDSQIWNNIDEGYTLDVELESITHKGAGGDYTEPYCDSDSLVSVIILLSDPQDFIGGVNYFQDGTEIGKRVELRKGDAVFFYGDACEHWVTAVTDGSQAVLKLELSTGHRSWDNAFLLYACVCLSVWCGCSTIAAMYAHWICFLAVPPALLFMTWYSGGGQYLPIGIRCSLHRKVAVAAAVLFFSVMLALIPVVWSHWCDIVAERRWEAKLAAEARRLNHEVKLLGS